MAFHLSPEAVRGGYGLVGYETVASTNADALDRLRAGGRDPLWVVSRHQSEGRGRRGNSWQSPPGNLAASLALRLDLPPAVVATLGFVAGVALVRALERVCPLPGGATPFRLKWPNDVLADDAKLAGILLETEIVGRARAVVIGIGVNVAHAPGHLPYRTESLAGLGLSVSAEDLFAALSAEWVDAFARWEEGRGFGATREAWLARAAGLGGPATVRMRAADLAGRFEALDEQGQLLLRLPDGTLRPVSAGEVHFGAGASSRAEIAA